MTDEDEKRASVASQDPIKDEEKVETPVTETPETEETTPAAPAPKADPNENVAPSEEKKLETTELPEAEKTDVAVELPHADLKPGMLVRVHERIKETNAKGETKERFQIFEGMLIGLKSSGIARTMTVRKNSKGWMVEKIFPLSSPNIEKVEVVKRYETRRAKLHFLRGKHKRKLKEIKE